MVNGSFWVNFCIVAVKKKSLSNATNFLLGFFLANFAIFPLEIVKSCQV
jgi:succinate-acetate transporter protein